MRQRDVLAALTVISSGLCAALGSHATFFFLQRRGILGSSYLHHDHASIAYVTLIASLLACALGVIYVLECSADGSRLAIVHMARDFSTRCAAAQMSATAIIALAALSAMEGSEGALSAAFGAIPFCGVALVVAIAAATAFLARAFARWIAGATEVLAAVLRSFFLRVASVPSYYRVQSFVLRRATSCILSRLNGLRAPPSLLA